MQLDPNHRPTISEVLAHPWFKGDTATRDEIISEFKQREIEVKKVIEAERQEKAAEKARQNAAHAKTRRMRSAKQGEEESKFDDEELLKPEKKLDMYIPAFQQMTEFYSTYNPDIIEEKMKTVLQQEKIEPKINGEKYKMKFSRTTQNKEGQNEVVDI